MVVLNSSAGLIPLVGQLGGSNAGVNGGNGYCLAQNAIWDHSYLSDEGQMGWVMSALEAGIDVIKVLAATRHLLHARTRLADTLLTARQAIRLLCSISLSQQTSKEERLAG